MNRRELWQRSAKHPGDRPALFAEVARLTGAQTALYPGSYIDIAPSTAFPEVHYLDVDRRANTFFSDPAEVRAILAELNPQAADAVFSFRQADYREPLDLPPADLLLSLYAGPISHYCTDYLRVGGHLLAVTSHGDVTLALRDPRYRLEAVLNREDGGYRTLTTDLERFTQVKGAAPETGEILQTCLGGKYRTPATAYLFQRVA